MKRVVLFITLFLFSTDIFAYDYDVILTKDRNQIQCFIVEENDERIIYMLITNDVNYQEINRSDILHIYYGDKVSHTSNLDTQDSKQNTEENSTYKEKLDSLEFERAKLRLQEEQIRIAKEREYQQKQQQEEERIALQEVLNRQQQQLQESASRLGEAIGGLIAVKNSYGLQVTNSTRSDYYLFLDGNQIGRVGALKTEVFVLPISQYGKLVAKQLNGYFISPTIKEYRIAMPAKQSRVTIVIK